MRELRVGDKVDVHDSSYCFGVRNDKYSTHISNFNDSRKGLIVIKTGLEVMEYPGGETSGVYSKVNDILATDGDGGYWFIQSRFVRLCTPDHTISFDGSEPVTISDQSYQALKKSLTQ